MKLFHSKKNNKRGKGLRFKKTNRPVESHHSPSIKNLLGSKRANKIYREINHPDVKIFLENYIKKAHLKHKISRNHFERIPSEKSLLILANHPTGIPDGLLVLDTLLKVRNDVKLIIDQNTYPFEALKSLSIGIDTSLETEITSKNEPSLKEAMLWLESGHCLVLFSNSEVNLNPRIHTKPDDKFWHPFAKQIITQFQGAILPWAIRGKNSPWFYQLSKIAPQLKNKWMIREGLKRRFRPLESSIGKPFKFSDEQSLIDLELKIRLMTKKPQKFDIKELTKSFPYKKLKPISNPESPEILAAEISNLGKPLAVKGKNEVYLSKPEQSPHLLLEIGRLREITFREIGEGSGKKRDLDIHDDYFYHLILWDSESQKIAGAYRLGMGSELLKLKRYKPVIYEFYQRNKKTDEILNDSMIMGRAFVSPEYQSKPFPLFLLWNGIMEVLKQREEIKFLIGQTSLPNTYHPYSKQLITGFLWEHYADQALGKYFKPFHPLKTRKNTLIRQWIQNSDPNDIKRMDKIIECIEPEGAKTPMLFKRYIEQKALCIGINVDPDFQNSIDILMITKVEDIL